MSDDNKVMVKFLKAFDQAFTGTDLREYGPFEEGDILRMPEGNAAVLAERGYLRRFGSDS